MNVLSLFNGISVGYQALLEADIKVDNYFSSEVQESVIINTQLNFPETIQLGDVTKWKEWDLPKIDLVIGGSPCFAVGTKIITEKGYKNIEDIKLGDRVLTHENRYREVIDFGSSIKNQLELNIQGTTDIITTENHPFYVKRKSEKNKEPQWLKASELIRGDFVGVNINRNSNNHRNLSSEDCWLIGRYLADGHYRKDKSKNRNNSYMYQVIISVGKGKEAEFKSKIKNRKFSFYSHSEGVSRACFSSMELVNLIQDLNLGKGAETKRISKELLDLPIDLLKEVLEGYLSGDGYLNDKGRFKFSTVSKELALSLSLATIKCYGTPCMLTKTKAKDNHYLKGRKVKQREGYEGYFFKDVDSRKKSYFQEGDILWLPFKKMELKNEGVVYNMTVEEDNTYTADNIIVHNCQGFSKQGKGLNFKDPRSKLFFEFDKIVKHFRELNPNMKFLLENVNMKKEWEQVITDYVGVEPIHINSDLLLPHNRPRTYWTDIKTKAPQQVKYKLLDLLEKIELEDYTLVGNVKVCNSFSEKSKELLSYVDGELRVTQPVKKGYAVAEIGDGINISFPSSKTRRGRVIKNRSSCLDTACDIGVYDQLGQVRRFTINELEKLQGLPCGYLKHISDAEAKKALGNGWTMDIIAHILKGLKEEE